MDKTESTVVPHCNISELKDGDRILGVDGYCYHCSYAFGGSMSPRDAMYLQGKFYHPSCYPAAVDVYIATEKLKKAREGDK